MFVKVLKNGEAREKILFAYSESLRKVFCGPCLLFYCDHNNLITSTVYNNWKNSNACFNQHENSNSHKQSISKKNDRKNNSCRIDKHTVLQINVKIIIGVIFYTK